MARIGLHVPQGGIVLDGHTGLGFSLLILPDDEQDDLSPVLASLLPMSDNLSIGGELGYQIGLLDSKINDVSIDTTTKYLSLGLVLKSKL